MAENVHPHARYRTNEIFRNKCFIQDFQIRESLAWGSLQTPPPDVDMLRESNGYAFQVAAADIAHALTILICRLTCTPASFDRHGAVLHRCVLNIDLWWLQPILKIFQWLTMSGAHSQSLCIAVEDQLLKRISSSRGREMTIAGLISFKKAGHYPQRLLPLLDDQLVCCPLLLSSHQLW